MRAATSITTPNSAPPARRLGIEPDFLIIGAMKSGTTSIHHLLDADPRIFMPEGEVQLLSVDDIEQNPVFFQHLGDRWTRPSFEADFEALGRWHTAAYAGARPGQVLGEDAPSYLASRRAIDRLAAFLPEARLIVTLRDPVDRLESQYWHWVRTFRAHYDLEGTLQYQPGNLLQRSAYEEQLRHVFGRFPREQVLVLLFEALIRDEAGTSARLYDFLGMAPPESGARRSPHANPGIYPRFPRIAQWRNRAFRRRYGRRYLKRVPWMPEPEPVSWPSRLGMGLVQRLNRNVAQRPTPMRPETRVFLSALLRERNAGLGELLGEDLARYWPSFVTY